MKKLIFTLALAILLVAGYSRTSYAKSNNAVVDLSVTTEAETTEEVTGENPSSDDIPAYIPEDEDVIGGDLLPDVDADSFFEKIYNKMFSALSGVQKIVAVILLGCFAIATIMVVISCFGQKSKVPWYLFAMLIIALMLVCDIYAVPITSAFTKWFVS